MVEERPDNTYRPVLMDFGLARDASATEHLTETGMVMGTVKIILATGRQPALGAKQS